MHCVNETIRRAILQAVGKKWQKSAKCSALRTEIAEEYPHINLAQVYAALTYYHANRDEVDRELEAEAADFLRLAKEFGQPKE